MRRRPVRATWLGYGLASAVSLGADMGLFMALIALGLPPVPAATLGYGLGVLVHWFVSSRFVFVGRAARSGPARARQKGLFLGSALIGLAITTATVALGALLGLYPLLAKLVAVAVSFQTTYMLRKHLVFAR
jgi:putative flippase GtrA